MGGQTPEWLRCILVEALQNAGATAPVSALEAEASYLLGEWDGPGRAVHNGRYLATLLERLDEFEGATADPALLGLAACYQGAGADLVWETLGGSPRASSRPDLKPFERLTQLGVPTENAQRVADLVEKLNSADLPHDDLEAQILFDADLAILASPPQAYRRFRQSLRSECSALDDRSFLKARREFIQGLLKRRRIFLTPFAQHLAKAARDNLEGELSRIERVLAEPAGEPTKPTRRDKRTEHSGEGPRSGAIMIRRSRLHRERPVALETDTDFVEDNPAPPPPHKESRREIDDTSTLESIDDPFSRWREPRR